MKSKVRYYEHIIAYDALTSSNTFFISEIQFLICIMLYLIQLKGTEEAPAGLVLC